MSVVEGPPQGSEIIIVRRARNDLDDDHHGGVWKIAFADFMTAMMCFFLVMWLINAANEETKAAVASYFNPVKLTDRNSSRKTLSDDGNGPRDAGAPSLDQESFVEQQTAEQSPVSGKDDAIRSSDPIEQTQAFSDQYLFSDPYSVLAEIVSETGTLQNTSERGEGGAQDAGPSTGASGGESYRDPFAPDFWSKQIARPEDTGENSREGTEINARGEGVESFPKSPERPAPLPDLPSLAAEEPAPEPVPEVAKPEEIAAPVDEAKAAAAAEMVSVKKELEQALASSPELLKGITVSETDGGILISVTDQENYGMFEIGSAVPRRDLVLGMEKISSVIAQHSGPISIKGHTDSRPFKSETYDNWRLSTARAHSAYYMLVRGGLKEDRVTEVAGFADRQPKDQKNPLADVNRRIEILIGNKK